jgi:hypothetical protein
MPRRYKGRTLTAIRCQYCGESFPYLGQHLRGCVMEPEARARTRIALDDGTGTIRTIDDYKSDRRGGLAYKTLRTKYRRWHTVAEVFGLQPQRVVIAATRGNALDKRLAKLGPELDRQMAEYRRLTHAGYRG